MAGGLAMRLRPITATIPKALVEVAGEPFVFRQLRYLRGQGVSRVVLCVSYLGEQIAAVVGDGTQFRLEVEYSFDGSRLLGTAGALKRALPLLDDSFFVLYGDSYLPIDFAKVEQAYLASGAPGLMTVLRNDDRWDKSNVVFERGVILEYNKRAPRAEMTHIDYGLSVLSASVLADYPEGETGDLADVLHRLSVTGRLAAMEVFDRFYEIGSPKGLLETEDYFQENQ